jgi:hypothetical protein
MTYCSRDDAQRSMDLKDGVIDNDKLDRGLRSVSENIEAQAKRLFYPNDTTRWWDWPNQGGSGGGQYATPWTLRFDQYDCVVLTELVSGGVTIPLNAVFLEPVNKRPDFPYTYLELDRSQSYSFGNNGQTPQHNIMGVGTWGFTAAADPVTALAANVGSTDTTVSIANGAELGAGDLMILGYGQGEAPYPTAYGYAGAVAPYVGERIVVTGKTALATGLTQSGGGCTAASDADVALTTTGSGSLNAGEVLLLDQEQMLIEQTSAGIATVVRAWNGTALATHSAATVYAYRLLSVNRAQLGTTASTYSSGAGVFKHRVPGLVRDLCVAETVNRVLQESSGYSRTVGSGDAAMPASGVALADLWDEVMTAYGRRARQRAV